MELKHLSRLLRCAAAAMALCCAVGMTALAEEPATPETAAETATAEVTAEVTAEAPAEDSAPAEEASADAEGEGAVPPGYTGLFMYQNAWRYFSNGQLDYTYVGVAEARTPSTVERYYVKGSCVDFSFTGLALYGDTWYYFDKGFNNMQLGGFICGLPTSDWKFYINKGVVDYTYSGLAMYKEASGEWRWYMIRKGTIAPWDILNGAVAKHTNGWYYYINNNIIDKSAGGVNGDLVWGTDFSDPTLPDNQREKRLYLMFQGTCNPADTCFWGKDGKEYFILNGIWVGDSYNSLVMQNNVTYYVKNGLKATGFSGAAEVSNKRCVIKNGVVDTAFTGVSFLNNTGYYFKNGYFDATFNGTINYGNGIYTVKNGVVTGNTNYGSPDADERQIFEEIKEQRKIYGNWNDPNYANKYHNAAETLAKEQVTKKGGTRPNGKSWTSVLDENGWASEKQGRSAAMLYISGSESLTDTQIVKLMMDNANFATQVKNTKYNNIAVGRYVSGGYQYVVVLLMDL